MVGVGNHDMFYNGSAYATRFHMPWEVGGIGLHALSTH
jgi:hypothetical protein